MVVLVVSEGGLHILVRRPSLCISISLSPEGGIRHKVKNPGRMRGHSWAEALAHTILILLLLSIVFCAFCMGGASKIALRLFRGGDLQFSPAIFYSGVKSRWIH